MNYKKKLLWVKEIKKQKEERSLKVLMAKPDLLKRKRNPSINIFF